MLADEQLVHVVGCYTSSSRKEVLPFFEKYDGLLWYPSHYEGFESSENVVYTGAAPNQHIVPLADYLLRSSARRAYFVGSNYIWAWENNKIMREAVQDAGGQVMAERYLPVSEARFRRHHRARCSMAVPSFVFNTLIGDIGLRLLPAFRAPQPRGTSTSDARCRSRAAAWPSPSWSRSAPRPRDGHISSSVYFESVETPTNRAFRRGLPRRLPAQPARPAPMSKSSYIAVHLLARACGAPARADMVAVRAAVPERCAFEAPQGRVHIDRDNRHCYLTPRIGVSTEACGFDIIYEADGR